MRILRQTATRRGPVPGVAKPRAEARLAGWLAARGLRESALCLVVPGRNGRGILKSALSRKFRFGFNEEERKAVLAWASEATARRVAWDELFEGEVAA